MELASRLWIQSGTDASERRRRQGSPDDRDECRRRRALHILPRMRWISGCLTKLVLWTAFAVAAMWALTVALSPWALHIGGRSTPLLYWHGTGTVRAKGGKALPLYVSFWPGRPQGFHGGGRREGKGVSAHIDGDGFLCIAPGNAERMNVSVTMYGGYLYDSNSLLDFRLLEWRR